MSSEYGKKHDGVDGDVQDGVHLEKEANFPSKNESKKQVFSMNRCIIFFFHF